MCIFFCFLSFVRKKYSNFGVDKLASCIRMLSLNASMPRSTPSLFAGYHICMTKEKGWVKRHDINKGVYLTLCLRQLGISQIQSHYSLELSNGRCPGCDFFIPVWLYVSHHCILTDAVCFCVHIPHG